MKIMGNAYFLDAMIVIDYGAGKFGVIDGKNNMNHLK